MLMRRRGRGLQRASRTVRLLAVVVMAVAEGCASPSAQAPPRIESAPTQAPVAPDEVSTTEAPAVAPIVVLADASVMCRVAEGRVECRTHGQLAVPTIELAHEAVGLFLSSECLGVIDGQALRWPLVPAACEEREIDPLPSPPPDVRRVFTEIRSRYVGDPSVAYAVDGGGTLFRIEFREAPWEERAWQRIDVEPNAFVDILDASATRVLVRSRGGQMHRIEMAEEGWRARARTATTNATGLRSYANCRPEGHGTNCMTHNSGTNGIDVSADRVVQDVVIASRDLLVRGADGSLAFVALESGSDIAEPLALRSLDLRVAPDTEFALARSGLEIYVCAQDVARPLCLELRGEWSERGGARIPALIEWVPEAVRRLPPGTSGGLHVHRHSCALDSSGATWCWGERPGHAVLRRSEAPVRTPFPPSRALRLDGLRVCALGTDDVLRCATLMATPFEAITPSVVASSVKDFVLTAESTCVLYTDGGVECGVARAPSGLMDPQWLSDAGSGITQLAGGWPKLCALDERGGVSCAAVPRTHSRWPRLHVVRSLPAAAEMALDGWEVCVVARDGRAFCNRDGGFERESSLDGGPLVTALGHVYRVEEALLAGPHGIARWTPSLEPPPLSASMQGGVHATIMLSRGATCRVPGGERRPLECHGLPEPAPLALRQRLAELAGRERAARLRHAPRLLRGPARLQPLRARMYRMLSGPGEFPRRRAHGETPPDPCADRLLSRTEYTECPNLPQRGVALSDADATELEAVVRDPHTYESSITGCYFPRHEVLYFDASDRVIARIEICFECRQIRTEPDVIRDMPTPRSMHVFADMCRRHGLGACGG